MRIVHCLRAPVGGLFRHVLDLAQGQVALGHDVGLIADANACDALTEQRLADVAPRLTLGLARIPMHRNPAPSDFWAHRTVVAHVRRVLPDILHGHGAKGGAYARLAGRTLKAEGSKVKTFYTPHGGTLNYRPGSIEGRVFAGMEIVLDRMTDGLIFESAFAARVYGQRVGRGTAPRRVIHNGLQPRDFFDHTPNPDAADFLFVGELRDLKGVDVLLRALAAVNRDRDQPLSAVIVGAGPDRDGLVQLSRSLGLSASVAFPGAMPAKEAFPLGRAMVVPSRKESFPYVVLEAAAAGMPLVATNVGGIPEIVEGTDTGLIPADNIVALSNALMTLESDRPGAILRAHRLKASVEKRFTGAAMTQEILGFYGSAGAKGSVAHQSA